MNMIRLHMFHDDLPFLNMVIVHSYVKLPDVRFCFNNVWRLIIKHGNALSIVKQHYGHYGSLSPSVSISLSLSLSLWI